ncbi:intracellular protease, PfpI family [Pseudopedobacter saltans DSM 12145]|uniref:Intracellular protease, PfpI family n=1 Tax=Pseudopedobacter saltans (strain ATCC 51119 / DSM 12145 / JCM 21818 / CCUG 39354 / LMG 10337 / NBRC 100064 / NCIMB 13643) TaxID=762903 RepID=F0S6B5_PSESL|nr:DJ-1/PfpI family protein [Pseudopedobacter saltans]ADY53229.1 intracellular protease, PfpI family [Pseudopedobacter saltans DSM 12145]
MSKRILMLAGDFVEDYEIMVPYQALLSVGLQVDVVCPDKKKGDSIATAIHDFVGFQTYAELRGHNFVINKSFDDVNLSDYDGLYVCGGRAPEYIRLNQKVLDYTRHFFEENKPVAAICHGIQILTAANVVKGKTLTAYPAVGPEITLAGGTYKEIPVDQAITEHNLTTSPAWPGHPAILKEFYKLLGISIHG